LERGSRRIVKTDDEKMDLEYELYSQVSVENNLSCFAGKGPGKTSTGVTEGNTRKQNHSDVKPMNQKGTNGLGESAKKRNGKANRNNGDDSETGPNTRAVKLFIKKQKNNKKSPSPNN
jgi:hypothetical protein